MINEEQIRTLRNNASHRMEQLSKQADLVRTEMSTLQERFGVKQTQLNTLGQQLIETNATLVSLNEVLGPDVAVGVALPPRQITATDRQDDGA
jgi:peptidoglycan hydrolase CwlO-like protein